MIDRFSEIGQPGDGIDVAVGAPAAIVTVYLRAGHRVGTVALGGLLRWLSPGASTRQF